MKLFSIILILTVIIALISIFVLVFLKTMNNAVCKLSEIFPYNTIVTNFNGIIFKTDDIRYSAEIIARTKINDAMDKLILDKTNIKIVDTDKINKTIDVLKGIDNNINSFRDDTIYKIITTTFINDNPTFINVLNDPDYLTIIEDYNINLKKFNEYSTRAKKIASEYSSYIHADSLDADVFKTLMYG